MTMEKLVASSKVYVKKSQITGAGRGVFAKQEIKKGELIERCPIIEVPKHDVAKLNESVLVTYFFYFGKGRERIALTLGFGSIYNHSYTPNATYKINPGAKTIDFTAVKDIKHDSEITFNYYHSNKPTDWKRPLWFEGA